MLNFLCKLGGRQISLGKARKSRAGRFLGCTDRFRNRFTVALQHPSIGGIIEDESLHRGFTELADFSEDDLFLQTTSKVALANARASL
jgi:hypothetical protein